MSIKRKSPTIAVFPVTVTDDEEVEDMVSNQVFSTLYNSPKYSDLIIRCRDRTWNAHKAVICPQSKVLSTMVNGPFRESITGEIDLSEDDPEILEHMMSFLYRGYYDFGNPLVSISYTPPPSPGKATWAWLSPSIKRASKDPKPTGGQVDLTPYYSKPVGIHENPKNPPAPEGSIQKMTRKPPYPSRLLTHASVYCIAEQYHIPRLKNHALCKYATLSNTEGWKSPYFVPSIAVIYAGTPTLQSSIDDLRAVAVRVAAEHSQFLLDKIDFLELCSQNGEIATDILKATLNLRLKYIDGKERTVVCKVDSSHDLIYVPTLTGFGSAANGLGRNMMGFGNNSGGQYKCAVCGGFVN